MSIFDLESDTLGQAGSADIPYTSKEGRSISKEYERLYLFDESPEIEDRAFDDTIKKLGLDVEHPRENLYFSLTNSKEEIEKKYAQGKQAVYAAVMQARVEDPFNKELMSYPTSDEELKSITGKTRVNAITAKRLYDESEYASFTSSMAGSMQAQFGDTPMLAYLATIPVMAFPAGLATTAAGRIGFWVAEGMVGSSLIELAQQSKSRKLIKELDLTLENPKIREELMAAGFDPDTLNITEEELNTRLLYAWTGGALLGGAIPATGALMSTTSKSLRNFMKGDPDSIKIVDEAIHQSQTITAGGGVSKMNQGELMAHIKKVAEASHALQFGKNYVKKDLQKITPMKDLDKGIDEIEKKLLKEGETFSKKQRRKLKALMDDTRYDIELHNSVVDQKHLNWSDEAGEWQLKVTSETENDIFSNAKILQESFNEVIKQTKVMTKLDSKFIQDRLKELGVDDSQAYIRNLPKDPEERRLKLLNDNAKVRLLTQLVTHKVKNETTNIGRYMSMQKLATDFLEVSYSRGVIPGNVTSVQRATFQDFMNRLDDPALHNIKWDKISEHDMNNIVRAMYGEATTDEVANRIAKRMGMAMEDARVLKNHYGGNIAERINYFPQHHDGIKVGGTAMVTWRDFIKPRLDKVTTAKNLGMDKKFLNEDGSLNAAGEKDLDRILEEIHDHIARGEQKNPFESLPDDAVSFRTRDSQMRFLIFDKADGYLEYSAKYGKNPIQSLSSYFNHISNDIAFMKVFGPNVVQNARGIVKFAESFDARALGRSRKEYAFNRLFDHIAGTDQVVANKVVGKAGSEIRAGLVTAQLGSAYLASLADLAFGWLTRSINGMESTGPLGNYVKFMAGNKNIAREANVVGLEIGEELRHSARIHGDTFGDGPFSWMANNLMKISLLQPGTIAGRTAFKYEFQFHLRDIAKKSYGSLNKKTLDMYKRYGITKVDHDALSKVKLFKSKYDTKVNYLRVSDIEDREIRQRFYTYMYAETEAAVPSYMARSRADMMSLGGKTGLQPGTGGGELARSLFLFKNFPMTIMYTHLARNMNMLSKGTGGAGIVYASQTLLATSVAGYLIMNARKVMQGEDTTTLNPKSISQGMMYGGGLGIFGDMVLHDSTQYGQSFMGTLAGPVFGFGNDVLGLTGLTQFQDALYRGKDTTDKLGGKFATFLDRYTPYNNLWYTRAATDRLIFDNIRKYLDTDYHGKKMRQERRLRKENRSFFIDRESLRFKRAPNIQLFDWKNYE